MITISIVEDNDPFRQGLEAILRNEPDFFVVDAYADAESALAKLPEAPPDILIADISLPGMKGTELIVRLRDKLPQTQFMVCSIHDDDDTIFEALQCGASGYILKDPVTAADITRAVRDLYNGGSPMSPYIARRVIGTFQKPVVNEETSLLSPREREVLTWLSKGLSYKEIARHLDVTSETVKMHLKNIYRKLHVQNKVEALNKFRLL